MRRAEEECDGDAGASPDQAVWKHGSTCPLGRAGRSGQGCAFSCLGRFVVHQRGRADGGWRTDGRSLRSPHSSRLSAENSYEGGTAGPLDKAWVLRNLKSAVRAPNHEERIGFTVIANAFQGDSVCHIISIPNWRGKIRASTSATFIYLTAPRARR